MARKEIVQAIFTPNKAGIPSPQKMPSRTRSKAAIAPARHCREEGLGVFVENVDNFAVLEEPGNNEEALVGGDFDLGSRIMGASHFADIDPEKKAGKEEFDLP